ncbi:MAG: hypothetical protein ACP5O7_11615 [Phycisphaerae bacterium]
MATAVPTFAADNTNAGLEITDGTPPVSQSPVAVGVDDTVNFVASTTTGTDHHEGVPPGLKSETLVMNAPNGVISAMSAQGFGSAVITNGGATATITGHPSAASFPVGATLEYPDGNGGDQTVTCTGQLLFNDGTTTNSNPDGSVNITAVQVSSVALADDPTQVKLGQTLTRKDFNMITKPTGYGDFTYPSGDGSGPGAFIVDFSPASFSVGVGDNPVQATCGTSSADLDLIGVEEKAGWTSASYNVQTGLVTANFFSEIEGLNGFYSVTGPNVTGAGVSGNLSDGQLLTGTATFDPSLADTDAINVSTQQGGTGGTVLQAGQSTDVSAWDLFGIWAGYQLGEGPGAVYTLAAEIEFLEENVKITPGSGTQLLSLATANLAGYQPFPANGPPIAAQVTSMATWSASGESRWGIVGGYYYTDDPKFQINCGAPTYAGQVTDIATGANFSFETKSFIDVPTVPLGQWATNEGALFCGGNANGVTQIAPGATQANGAFSGRCGIQDDDGSGTLLTSNNDPGWVAGPAPLPASQTIEVEWFY